MGGACEGGAAGGAGGGERGGGEGRGGVEAEGRRSLLVVSARPAALTAPCPRWRATSRLIVPRAAPTGLATLVSPPLSKGPLHPHPPAYLASRRLLIGRYSICIKIYASINHYKWTCINLHVD